MVIPGTAAKAPQTAGERLRSAEISYGEFRIFSITHRHLVLYKRAFKMTYALNTSTALPSFRAILLNFQGQVTLQKEVPHHPWPCAPSGAQPHPWTHRGDRPEFKKPQMTGTCPKMTQTRMRTGEGVWVAAGGASHRNEGPPTSAQLHFLRSFWSLEPSEGHRAVRAHLQPQAWEPGPQEGDHEDRAG